MEIIQLDKFLFGSIIILGGLSLSALSGERLSPFTSLKVLFSIEICQWHCLIHGFTVGFVCHHLLTSFATLMVKEESGQRNSADF